MRVATRPMVAIMLICAIALSGCAGVNASKSGGGTPPITVRLGSGDTQDRASSEAVSWFARRIEDASAGTIQVDIAWQSFLGAARDDPTALDDYTGHPYAEVARQLEAGELDLAVVPDFAWIERGAEGVSALKVPLLIDSVDLMAQVSRRLGDQSLAGLRALGAEPLVLMPEALRHPVGFGRSFVRPEDFAGQGIRVSDFASGPIVTALGGDPLTLAAIGDAVSTGRVTGAESTYALAGTLPDPGIYTGDVFLLAKFNTIAASSGWWATLSPHQREVIQDAATATREHVLARRISDAQAGAAYCAAGGTVVHAGTAGIAAFTSAVHPIVAELRSDPRTRDVVAAIEKLKQKLPPGSPASECSPAAPVAPATDPDHTAAFPEGTFRAVLTMADFAGIDAENARQHAGIWTLIFHDGKVDGIGCAGSTYEVSEGRVVVTLGTGAAGCGDAGGEELFSALWSFDGRVLRFRDVSGAPSAQRFNEVLWGSKDWVKIG